MTSAEFTPQEQNLVEEAQRDDIDMAWTLIHLGIRLNDGTDPERPSPDQIERAFGSLERLTRAGLIRVGHTEYVDGGPPGRVAPVRLVEEALPAVKQRVLDALRNDDSDWQFASWLTAT